MELEIEVEVGMGMEMEMGMEKKDAGNKKMGNASSECRTSLFTILYSVYIV
jgi:hypothetical protein